MSSANDLLTRDQIEQETGGGVSRRWLELAAHRGDGPPYVKLSHRAVRYRRADFESWLSNRTIKPGGNGRP